MPTIQVTSLHPVRVDAENAHPTVVKNESGATVYYRSKEVVTATLNDGNLTTGQEVTLYGTTWFVTKAGLEPKEGLPEAEIRTTVTQAPYIAPGNLEPASKPAAAAAESLTAVIGTAGVCRCVNAAITAKAATSTYKVIHNLGTSLLDVSVTKEKGTSGSEPTIPEQGANSLLTEWKVKSENEIEVVLSNGAGIKAKEVYWVTITG